VWCKSCNHETNRKNCELCGKPTVSETPIEVYWCEECAIPIIKTVNDIDKSICPRCGKPSFYICADLRPVFPEERLLLEILQRKPLAYINDSVWACDNRYYINGKPVTVTSAFYKKNSPLVIREHLSHYNEQNSYAQWNMIIARFIEANKSRLIEISDEAKRFISESWNFR